MFLRAQNSILNYLRRKKNKQSTFPSGSLCFQHTFRPFFRELAKSPSLSLSLSLSLSDYIQMAFLEVTSSSSLTEAQAEIQDDLDDAEDDDDDLLIKEKNKEETDEEDGNPRLLQRRNLKTGQTVEDEARAAFAALRPYCVQLLEKHMLPKEQLVALREIRRVVTEVTQAGLSACLDYVLFGVLLVIDGAVGARTIPKSSEGKTNGRAGILYMGKCDAVAEAALQCLEGILSNASLQSPEQMVMLFQHIIPAAMLSQLEASEEFRHGAVTCLYTLIKKLEPCGWTECDCIRTEQSKVVNKLSHGTRKAVRVSGKCPLAALQEEEMAVTVGHLFSLMLQIAQGEATAGQRGSRALRICALSTLRCLLRQVCLADSLVFFLPGVTSGLAKAMLAPARGTEGQKRSTGRTAVTAWNTGGAGGSSKAVVEAVGAMSDLLELVLSDFRNSYILSKYSQPRIRGDVSQGSCELLKEGNEVGELKGEQSFSLQKEGVEMRSGNEEPEKNGKENFFQLGERTDSAEVTLEAMRQFSVSLKEKKSFENQSHNEAETSTISERRTEENLRSEQKDSVDRQGGGEGGRVGQVRLKTERNELWLKNTAEKICDLLRDCIPLLSLRGPPAVRLAVGDLCGTLLSSCSVTLKEAGPLFLECLLGLSFDDWPAVAKSARCHLADIFRPSAQTGLLEKGQSFSKSEIALALIPVLDAILQRLLLDLPTAVRNGQVANSLLKTRQLMTILHLIEPRQLAHSLFLSQKKLELFAHCFTECLKFSEGSSFLLELRSSSFPMNTLSLFPFDGGNNSFGEQSIAGDKSILKLEEESTNQIGEANKTTITEGLEDQFSSSSMPSRLAFVRKKELYTALIRVLQTTGQMASQAAVESRSGSILTAVLEPFLSTLRTTAREMEERERERARGDTGDMEGGESLQLKAATATLITKEIVAGTVRGCMNPNFWSICKEVNVNKNADSGEKAQKTNKKENVEFQEGIETNNCENRRSTLTPVNDETERERESGKIVKSDTRTREDVLSLVENVVTEFTAPQFWMISADGAPVTWHNVDEGGRGRGEEGFGKSSMRDANDVALLQQLLLDGLGSMAFALGTRFEKRGSLLFQVLPTLLECLGDRNASVSFAAQNALTAISNAGGHISVGAMVLANADYVVEVLCRGMRHLSLHPHTPQLLVAVLHHTGAAPNLLPLLHEPMRAVLRGLRVTARRRHGYHTSTFLLALRELSISLRAEAFKAQIEAEEDGDIVTKALEIGSRRREGKENGKEREEDKRKKRANFLPTGLEKGVDEGPKLKKWSIIDVEEATGKLENRGKLLRSLSGLSSGCLEASSPLICSKELQQRLIALDVSEAAIFALYHVETALKLEEREFETLKGIIETLEEIDESEREILLEDDLSKRKSEDETNRLLPRVHHLWPFLVACVGSNKTPAIIRALEVIASVAHVSGGHFISRRIRDDLWSLLTRLLLEGSPLSPPSYTSLTGNPLLMAPKKSVPRKDLLSLDSVENQGEGEGKSVVRKVAFISKEKKGIGREKYRDLIPMEVVKIRKAVLEFITRIAGGEGSKNALSPLVKQVAAVIIPFLGRNFPPDLQKSAGNAIVSLANIDSDSVWLLLSDLIWGGQVSGSERQKILSLEKGESEILRDPTSSTEGRREGEDSGVRGEERDKEMRVEDGRKSLPQEGRGECKEGDSFSRVFFPQISDLLPPWESEDQAIWVQWADNKAVKGGGSISREVAITLLRRVEELSR